MEEQRGELGLPGDRTRRQGSVRERHPIGCHSQHRPLSGARGCKGAHDKRSVSSALHRSSAEQRRGGRGICAPCPRLRPARCCLSGLAAEGSWSPAPWAGRAMPCGSSSKGTVCCHASLTAEGAQGGPGAGEGLARVPGRSPLPKLRHGDSATQHRRLSGPWEVRELQPGPPSPLRFSSVPSASQKGVRESLCAHEEPRRGGARVLGPPPSVWPSPWTGPWQALAASN